MRKKVLYCFIIIYCIYTMMTLGAEESVYVPILNDTFDYDDFNLPSNFNDTILLRYGHHRIHDCKEFRRAYFCIMRCLEKGYHIAESNKNCKCVCFKDYVKEKYYGTLKRGWKYPTTSLPPWADKIRFDTQNGLALSYEEDDLNNSNNTATTISGNSTDTESTGDGVSNEESTNHDKDGNDSGDENKEEDVEGEDAEGEDEAKNSSSDKSEAEKNEGEKSEADKSQSDKSDGDKSQADEDNAEKDEGGEEHEDE